MRFPYALLYCIPVCLPLCLPPPASAQLPVVAAAVGTVSGTVTDDDGALVPGAHITLLNTATNRQRSVVTGDKGNFTFTAVSTGTYTLAVTAKGLQPASIQASLSDGQLLELPPIALRVATANTDVEVTLTRQEMAEEDLHVAEKQRLAGFVPNFYVVYDWNAPPLTPKQKFKLATRTLIDPANAIILGGIAGLEQASNAFPGYQQGAAGYGKRLAAGTADFSIGTMLGGAVLPVLFRQDPRYFYKGTGSIRSRAFYALSTSVISRGDNGRWQPAYAAVLGNFASGAISNLYYPASNRTGAGLTVENGLLGVAADGVSNLIQEFILRKVTPGSRTSKPATP
jgi:hypothetical protein